MLDDFDSAGHLSGLRRTGNLYTHTHRGSFNYQRRASKNFIEHHSRWSDAGERKISFDIFFFSAVGGAHFPHGPVHDVESAYGEYQRMFQLCVPIWAAEDMVHEKRRIYGITSVYSAPTDWRDIK